MFRVRALSDKQRPAGRLVFGASGGLHLGKGFVRGLFGGIRQKLAISVRSNRILALSSWLPLLCPLSETTQSPLHYTMRRRAWEPICPCRRGLQKNRAYRGPSARAASRVTRGNHSSNGVKRNPSDSALEVFTMKSSSVAYGERALAGP